MFKFLFAGLSLASGEEALRKKKSSSDGDNFENGAPDKKADEIIVGGGWFYDDDGNMMPTERMSDGRYDHLGHLPDVSLTTDSFVRLQVPMWRVIESKIRTNPEDYIVIC